MFYRIEDGHGLPHDPLKAIVSPRPIGWISTRGKDGTVNLAPYSFFNMISGKPPLIFFSSERVKHSAELARESGEFVANLVGRDLGIQMNASAIDAPRDINEFDYSGLAMADCEVVSAPRVAEAPASLECKVTEIFHPKDINGHPVRSLVIVGQVVGVHIAENYLTPEGFFDTVKAGNMSRLGYMDFSTVDKVFAMRRPKWSERET
ncbi:flavin reductase family protein [Corticibacterium sp. UT-5YL-CI-8]|nr:flavin reductase family protein [Tianweitania sp. UT-5YL-CI-8]